MGDLPDGFQLCATKPKPKPEKRYYWGDNFLPKLLKKNNKASPGQMKFPWATWEVVDSEVRQVAEKFVYANCNDPKVGMQLFDES